MISIIVPTLNAEATLGDTLTALIPAVVEGIVREVIIVDGGSTDRTLRIADAFGAIVISSRPGRGLQLIAGAAAARGSWLLFLHADTNLEPGWERETAQFMERVELDKCPPPAAVFRFTLDDLGVMPHLVEAGVALRCALLKLPYGDQGLLMQRILYDEIGGYRPLPLMEDVDIVRRLGRARLALIELDAVTSAARYRRDGWWWRPLRNLTILTLWHLGVSAGRLVKLYR